jgi:hypothetical protein
MIDTVIANFDPYPCRDGVAPIDRIESDLQGYPGWRFVPTKPSVYQGEHRAKFVLKREVAPDKYLTVYGYNDVIDGIKVSLPNVLHGDNSRLLTSQSEIDEALARVSAFVEEIAPVHLTSIPLKFTHVHLTVQIHRQGVSCRQFFNCFRNFRHPRIHEDSVDWKVRGVPSGIQLLADNLNIGAYDKRLEKYGVPGDVVRFEIKLSGRALKKFLGPDNNTFPGWLQFRHCYKAFRELMLAFPSVRSLQARCPLKGLNAFLVILLADLDRRGITMSNGQGVLCHLADFSCRNFRTVSTERRIRAAVAATVLNDLRINFSEIFRPQWPPIGLVSNLNQFLESEESAS